MVLNPMDHREMEQYRQFHILHLKTLDEPRLLKLLTEIQDICICQNYALIDQLSDQYNAFLENKETTPRATAIWVDGGYYGYVFTASPLDLGIRQLASKMPGYQPLVFDYKDFARQPFHLITRMWAEQYLCCALRMHDRGGVQTFVVMPDA